MEPSTTLRHPVPTDAAPAALKRRYPATAALTSGYVFRVENQATVFFLQRVSLTGHLTHVSVAPLPPHPWLMPQFLHFRDPLALRLLYAATMTLAIVVIALFIAIEDYWAIAIFAILATARFLNIIVVRRRARRGGTWKGLSEPGEKGDLLILLSQDRWVRMQGLVDDLKAVTSGLWLADSTFAESSATALATVLIYVVAALATNVSQHGSVFLVVLLLGSVGLLALVNEGATALRMHGRELQVVEKRHKYERRRVLADELIKETGRRDWALALGIVPAEEGEESKVAVM